MKRRCRWEICRSIDDLYFARFVAGNGRKLLVTETYTRKENAVHAVEVLRKAYVKYAPIGMGTSTNHPLPKVVDLTTKGASDADRG